MGSEMCIRDSTYLITHLLTHYSLSVILTLTSLYYRKPGMGVEVQAFPWQIISHCSWAEGNHFVDVLTNTYVFSIPCGSALKAVILYQLLCENRVRMKNPGYTYLLTHLLTYSLTYLLTHSRRYMTGLVNIESVYAQESLGVDAHETEVTEADHLSFRLSLFLPDNPCEVEAEPVSTPGESPKPTAKLASPKVQAFTTQYAILLSIRARDFPFGDANMNVFGTLPEVLTITHLLTHSLTQVHDWLGQHRECVCAREPGCGRS